MRRLSAGLDNCRLARNVTRSRSLLVGGALLACIAILGVVAPILSPYSPSQIIPGARLLPPGIEHPLGTDALGRDLLVRVAVGVHLATRMAITSVGLSLLIGLALGSLAGFHGGWIDQVLARMMDGWLALPGALVALVVAARFGPSLDNLILALGLMGIPTFFRITRNATLGVRRAPYVEASIALGASDARLILRHVLPNISSPVVVLATLRLGTTLLTGSSLSFIGLGAQPPQPEWGALLATGRNYLDSAWWLAVFPGLAVTITVVGLNFLGDGLRDLLDPQTRPVASEREASAQDRPDECAETPELSASRLSRHAEEQSAGAREASRLRDGHDSTLQLGTDSQTRQTQ